jgi:hypothetical protein
MHTVLLISLTLLVKCHLVLVQQAMSLMNLHPRFRNVPAKLSFSSLEVFYQAVVDARAKGRSAGRVKYWQFVDVSKMLRKTMSFSSSLCAIKCTLLGIRLVLLVSNSCKTRTVCGPVVACTRPKVEWTRTKRLLK